MIDDPTAVTTVRRDWAGDEAAAPGAWRELERLGRRARRRWLRTVAYALLCSLLAVGAAARRPRSYASRVAFAVREGGTGAAAVPRTHGALRGYVGDVLFSSSRLASVIRRQDLYPALRARDPKLAVETMRDHLEVEVGRDDSPLPGAASAVRLAVTFHGDDPEKVYQTVEQLGRLVAESPPPRAREAGGRWVMIEPARIAPAGPSRRALLGWLGLCAFLLALPFCGIGVGAFDAHVYDLDDVRRLGVATLGALRDFDGDNAGALDSRLRDEDRARIHRL